MINNIIKNHKNTNDFINESSLGIDDKECLNELFTHIDIIKKKPNPDSSENIILKKITDFLKNERSNGISVEDFIKIINRAEFNADIFKESLIGNFLESKRSNGISVEDFIKIINRAEFKDDEYKYQSINKFLKSERSNGISVEDFIKIINRAEFKDDEYKYQSIYWFLKSERSNGISVEDFIKIINRAEFNDDEYKYKSIDKFLKSERSSNVTPQDLANIIKGAGLQNRADLSIKLYETKFSESENYIENFIYLTKALQPIEPMQCEFVKMFINENQINQNNVMGLKPFIEELQDNDLALDLLENLYRKRLLKDEKYTLSLVKNRTKKQYSFLTEIVGDKTLNDCITRGGIATLKTTFGEDLKVGDQPITVSDLISYYDLKDQAPTLFAMLKPEFKKQLRDNFAPSAEMLLYKPAELDKLNSLLGESGIEFDVKSYFVENAKLCDYLKEKVGNVEEIDSSKTYQINFKNFGIEEEKKAKINTLFNELLKSDDPNKERVANFFSDLLGIAFSDSDGDKLKIFFQENKKELAHCFCDKEFSIENFQSLFTTFRDGCFANIGTQFKKMLYGAMIKDEDAQILYAVADDKIFSGIINTHGHDIMFGNFSPINNSIIKSYSLSPMVLIKKLSEEAMLTPTKSWEIIGKIAGDDKKNEILETLSKSCSDATNFNQKAKEIASFLIVKEIVGEEKIKDLTSKNPQLKELADFVYDRSPDPSPRNLQQQDCDAPINLSGLLSCSR